MSEKLTLGQRIFKILIGLAMTYAGLGHLTWLRTEFLAQVPPWVPMNADLVVVLSGIVEIILGIATLIMWKPKYSACVGITLAAFFVAVFPGNISQYVNQIDAFGLDTDRSRFIRLFFQPVLIFWALWSSGAISWIQNKRRKE